MSYKYTVISDYPIAFYQSNGISSSPPLSTYQEVLDTFNTYQDFENAFINYEQVVGRLISDYSGCNNTAGYLGALESSNLPLVYGEDYAIKIDTDNFIFYTITNGYDRQSTKVPFGTADTSDHDFTLECWMYPSVSTTNVIPIIGDSTSNVGLFYDRGNIIFKLDSENLNYTIPYLNRAIHIIATYTQNTASLYINGSLEKTINLNNFLFTNTTLALTSGPTQDVNDYLLLNSIAFYRYALSLNQINTHYNEGLSVNPDNITSPDSGELFKFYDNQISTQFKYAFPNNKIWEDFLENQDLQLDTINNAISIVEGTGNPKTVELNHYILIPSGPQMNDSKIEWYGENGITIESSVDGTNFDPCLNGEAIPQYRLGTGNFDSSRNLYLRITLSTDDDSKYIPKLYSISINFYNDQIMYSQNSVSYFSKLQEGPTISVLDANVGPTYYPILLKDYRNGIRTIQDSGFYINTSNLIRTMEFFYTPFSLTDSGLVSSLSDTLYSASNYSWHNVGTISKTNISAIYVNGVNKTSQTDVSNVFKENELHHVVIVFSSPISAAIKMNHSIYGSIPALYQNLALYQTAFNQSKAIEHFDLYIGNNTTGITDSLVTLTENSFTPYDNDWLVYQTV